MVHHVHVAEVFGRFEKALEATRTEEYEAADDPALRAAAEEGRPGAAAEYALYLSKSGLMDESRPWWERAVEEGDARAARTLAIFARDRGLWDEAEHWYRRASDRDAGCAFGLANLIDEVREDADAALELYLAGAELGSLECRTNAALLVGGTGRLSEARSMLEQAAEEGDHVADSQLRSLDAIEEAQDECEGHLDALEDAAEAEPGGDVDEAEEILRELCMGEDHRYLLRRLPALADRLRDPAERVSRLRGDVSPVARFAHLLDNCGRPEEARTLLEEALGRHPDPTGFGNFVLGTLYREEGEYERAEAPFLRSARSGDAYAQWNMAVRCRAQGRLDEAQKWYEAVREAPEEEAPAYPEEIERALRRVEEDRRAAPALTAAEEARTAELVPLADAGDAGAARELGGLLRRGRALPEAIRRYRAAAEAGDPVAALELGRMLRDDCEALGRHITRWFLPAAEAGDVDAAEELGALYLRSKEKSRAERWMRAAARGGHPKAAWWVGDTADERGDKQEAERWWAVAAEGGFGHPAWRAGKSLVLRREHAAAEPLLRIAWARREEQEHLHEAAYWLGRALTGLERFEEAESWLRTAVEVHPRVQKGYTGFMRTALFDPGEAHAEALLALGRTEEAAGMAREVLEHTPQHATWIRILAEAEEQEGDLRRALERLEGLGSRGGAKAEAAAARIRAALG